MLTRIIILYLCCLCLNAHAQSSAQTEAADSLVYDEYVTAFSRAFFEHNEFGKALDTYEQADTASMTVYDLRNYAMAAYFKRSYQQALDIATYGLGRTPDDIHFVRLAFFCLVELRQYPQARQHANQLFSRYGADELSYYDYANFVRLLTDNPQRDPADRQLLVDCCRHLIHYYTTESPNPTMARHYAKRLLSVAPNDTQAQQVVNQQ